MMLHSVLDENSIAVSYIGRKQSPRHHARIDITI